MSKRKFKFYFSYIYFLIFIFFLNSCNLIYNFKANNFEALSFSDKKLILTLNIGLLQDSQFKEIDILTFRKTVYKVQKILENQISNLNIKFIVDQPLNAVYMMGTSFSHLKKNKIVNNDSKGITNSLFIWQNYFENQIRYDIVVTNANIEKGNLDINLPYLINNNKLNLILLNTPGRRAILEKIGILISFNNDINKINDYNLFNNLEKHLYFSILNLILGLNVEFLNNQKITNFSYTDLNKLIKFINTRIEYLKTILEFNKTLTKTDKNYKILSSSFNNFENEYLLLPSAMQSKSWLELINKQFKIICNKC